MLPASLLLAVGYVLVSAQSIKDLTTIRSAMFLHPEEGPYVEVYFTISGNALNYKRNDRRLYQGGVDIDIMVLEGNEVNNF